MRLTHIRKLEAFTCIELVVVVVVIAVLLSMLLPGTIRVKAKAPRINCVNNLKQIGTTYRIWPNELFPAETSAALGGWKDILTNANQGSLCWTNYALLANELGQSPKIIVCPADERKPADSFSNLLSNLNVSYFVGVSATDDEPNSLAGGDRNLSPGSTPKNDYGFSPDDGRGNDVAIQTNTKAGPVCWSLKMHSNSNSAGAGNILLGDGSVQQVTSGSICSNWLPLAGQTNGWRRELGQNGNWPAGHVPSAPSFRVLFP